MEGFGNIILYEMENHQETVSVTFKDETFWLTQKAMSELFGCSSDNISLHLKNIFSEGEFSYREILGNCFRWEKLFNAVL